MTVIPLSPYEILDIVLSVVLIYFMRKASVVSKDTKK